MNKEDVFSIIKGDTVIKHIFISSPEIPQTKIDKVFFTCKALEVEKELTFNADKNCYILTFTPEETENFKSSKQFPFDFDITIKLVDEGEGETTIPGDVYTIVYRQSIVVLPKTNKVAALGD